MSRDYRYPALFFFHPPYYVKVAATKNCCFIQSGMCRKNWRTANSSKHQVLNIWC